MGEYAIADCGANAGVFRQFFPAIFTSTFLRHLAVGHKCFTTHGKIALSCRARHAAHPPLGVVLLSDPAQKGKTQKKDQSAFAIHGSG